MIRARHPMKDQVAFASAASTGFRAANLPRSPLSLAAEASIAALRACGLTASDVDGICGFFPPAPQLQATLGIDEITWFANPEVPFVNQVIAATCAIHSGLADLVLVYHTAYRQRWNSSSAEKDPLRRSVIGQPERGVPESIAAAVGYSAWASRYLAEFDCTKESFGYVALSDRAYAAENSLAAKREPLSMDDYLSARMVRDPLCLLDMDVAVDGADAFVMTTVERARDLAKPPVLLHSATLGMRARNEEDQTLDLRHNGQQVVVESLRARSDFWIDDIDVYFPYDGFTVITLNWLENCGWCGPGEAGDLLRECRDGATGKVLLRGRVPMNPHGGALSEGATQGSGHFREAIHQLQGVCGSRQVVGAQTALITCGGFFFNSQGAALRRDD